jgi:hypothetical protein
MDFDGKVRKDSCNCKQRQSQRKITSTRLSHHLANYGRLCMKNCVNSSKCMLKEQLCSPVGSYELVSP